MKFPILYSKSKTGALWSWQVWTEGNIIKTEFGLVDGQKQIAERIAQPKNVGRSNATTAEAQANAEAQSMWQYQRDRRYVENPKDAEKRIFLPMLAKSKAVQRTESIAFPADLQIKFDGLRSMAYRDDAGKVRMMSRNGKFYDVPHLVAEIEKILPNGTIFDGELYHHGSSLQTINSWAKRTQPSTKNLGYRVYDVPEFSGISGSWMERRIALENIFNNVKSTLVTMVETRTVTNMADVFRIVETEFMPTGYEGGILRLWKGQYEFSKRSNNLRKIKLFDEDDFKIIGFKWGEPGTKEAEAVIWSCQVKPGLTFDVRPTGAISEREIGEDGAKAMIGQMFSVKYKGFSDDGKPMFPVGLGFKEDR